MSWLFSGYGSYNDFGDGDGVDRQGWRDKSDAAQQREDSAMGCFSRFLTKAKTEQSFPFTEDVVPAHCHLTDACWKSFKQVVTASGCTAKRREITNQEKLAITPKSKARKGKMYVVSVTAPVHPDQAAAILKEKKIKADAARIKKAEKAGAKAVKDKLEAEEKKKKEIEIKLLVSQDYAMVVGIVEANSKVASVDTDCKKRALDDSAEQEPQGAVSSSPLKKLKVLTPSSTDDVKLTAPVARLLTHVEVTYHVKLSQISCDIAVETNRERKRILDELDARMKVKAEEEKKKALAYRDSVKETISGLASGKAPSLKKDAGVQLAQ